MNGITVREFQDLILSVGTHRGKRRLSPLEVARLLEKAVRANMSKHECASALGVGTTQVNTFLKLLVLAPQIQHLADWRGTKNASIPFSTLAELARLSPCDQIEASQAILRHGMTWKEGVQLAQIVSRSGKAIEKCIADVLQLRPQIETRYLFVGAITSKHLARHLHSLPQSVRDTMMNAVMARLTGSDYSMQGRLGFRNFTFLSDHNLTRLLNQKPDEIERMVNELLVALRNSK